jgi:hypothetical protein
MDIQVALCNFSILKLLVGNNTKLCKSGADPAPPGLFQRPHREKPV